MDVAQVTCRGYFGDTERDYSLTVSPEAKDDGDRLTVADLGRSTLVEAPYGGTYHRIGNLQVYRDGVALGEFADYGGLRVTLVCPTETPPNGRWGLHFWSGPEGGPKSWIPLEVRGSPNTAGLESGRIAIGDVQRTGDTLSVLVIRWPADDIIIAWDG